MRKVMTKTVIAIFITQFLMAGIVDYYSLEQNDLEYISTESSETSGRDAPIVPCHQYGGMAGPVWENNNPYNTSDIVEYPPNTGNYYILSESNITNMNTTMSPVDNNSADLWSGPCTCAEIAAGSGVPTWDYNHSYYDPWQIVSWNSTYWIAQDSGALIAEEPGNEGASGSSYQMWAPCSERTLCAEFDGHGGPAWDSANSYAINDTVEWPVNSGQFWQSTTSGLTGEPNTNGKWIGPCSCEDIWAASTSLVWDSNSVYDAGMMVEFPAGSQDIWIAIAPSTTAGVDPTYPWADGNEWELCSSKTNESGGPCGGLTVVGVWDASIGADVTSGEIYEYPANSQNYYQVNSGGPFSSVSAPDVDLDVWSPIACPCKETWAANGQPVWDSATTYSTNSVVEWPAGSTNLYIAWATPGPGDEPGIDPEWRLCEGGNTCAGLTVVGVWDASIGADVTSGEIYEYPANSQNYYQVNSGGPFSSVSAPDVDLDVWSPVDCPCSKFNGSTGDEVWSPNTVVEIGNVYEYPANSGSYYLAWHTDSNGVVTTAPNETQADEFWSRACTCEEIWEDAGMPAWDATVDYDTGVVVEHPPNSGDVWIATDNSQLGDHPGGSTPPVWNKCVSEPESSSCAGLAVVGVWDSTINVTSGEIYEYPANSQNYYQVNSGGPFSSVSAPDVDLDVWSPIACPCKETWAANGQPVWDSATTYSTNSVVEWPAGSTNLYIAWATPGPGDEPGIDPEWRLCEGGNPCAGLTVVGVWDASIGADVTSGEIYEYPANSQNYYQVNSGGPFSSVSAPDVDKDVWSPIACPCKETWAANGQPVWDSANTGYSGNYVVEWPAGTGLLYISEGGGLTSSAGEPGVDSHWTLCENQTPHIDEEKISRIPSIGAFGTIVAITMGVIIANRRQLTT